MTSKPKRPQGPIDDQVRDNVAKLRKDRGLTYKALSTKLSEVGRPIPPLGLSRLESGERKVSAGDLVALAIVFDVSPVTLLMAPKDAVDKPSLENTGCGGPVQLTERVSLPWELAWRWMHGEQPIGSPGADPKFIAENRPYEKEIRAEIERFLAVREPEKPYLVTVYGPEMQAVKANIYSGEHAEYIAAELTDGLAGRRAADKADRLAYIRWELTERAAREAAREANERPDDEDARALAEQLSEQAEIAGWQAARAQLAAEARGVNIAKWLEENRRFVDPKDAD